MTEIRIPAAGQVRGRLFEDINSDQQGGIGDVYPEPSRYIGSNRLPRKLYV